MVGHKFFNLPESDYESYASDGTPTKKGQDAENQQKISEKPDPLPVVQKQVVKTRNSVTTQRKVVPTTCNDISQIAKKSQPTRISIQRPIDTGNLDYLFLLIINVSITTASVRFLPRHKV